MRDLELFGQLLQRERENHLKTAHRLALGDDPQALQFISAEAHQAELCTRLLDALKALAHDSGKFIQEYLK